MWLPPCNLEALYRGPVEALIADVCWYPFRQLPSLRYGRNRGGTCIGYHGARRAFGCPNPCLKLGWYGRSSASARWLPRARVMA